MARHHTCDLHGDKLIEPEVSTIRITGPLASVLNRRELHVGKPGAYDLAEFFGFVVARPEGLASIMADRRQAASDADLDRDATAADVAKALRVGALSNGTPAGPAPPEGRGRKGA